MALALAGARGQGGNTLNGLHPCTLPQRAPFAAVRRVSPLCAAFQAGCECARDSTAKAHVAPPCAKNTKSQSSNAIAILRGGAAEWTRPAACGGARDMELASTKSRIKGWRRNRRFSCSQQPAVRTVSRGCAGAAIGACLEKNKRGWHQKSRKRRRFKGFQRASTQIGGV